MGWLTTEECVWGDKYHRWVKPGHLFAPGPGTVAVQFFQQFVNCCVHAGTYKIPAAGDVPIDLRVSLLHAAHNPKAIHGSKVWPYASS